MTRPLSREIIPEFNSALLKDLKVSMRSLMGKRIEGVGPLLVLVPVLHCFTGATRKRRYEESVCLYSTDGLTLLPSKLLILFLFCVR
uniref:Uncharacterized protein n=1 Tax=Utricularia reniformis TaxID=192314 RepID=A0A1Y0B4V0_9LAMI|nr:hypothetical protein AEK19_MT2275 [Utricularia reniformis]ART32420.1 hypothetical protein AEK19_MT2275 [Utricularia reniformis]